MSEKLFFPALLILCGLAIGMVWPIILTLISQLSPPEMQGKAQAFAHFIFSLCMLCGPYLMLFYLFKHLALLQYGMAGVLLIAFLTLCFFHPRPEIAGPVGKDYD
jgi:MFS family permease